MQYYTYDIKSKKLGFAVLASFNYCVIYGKAPLKSSGLNCCMVVQLAKFKSFLELETDNLLLLLC